MEIKSAVMHLFCENDYKKKMKNETARETQSHMEPKTQMEHLFGRL